MYTILNLILFNLSILFLSFLFSRVKKFDFLKILILSIIIAWFFGFRPLNVGTDTLNYYYRFASSFSEFEIGFTLFNNFILSIFGNDHRIYFSLINFIMIMNLLIASKLFVKYPIYIFTAWILVSLPYSILMQVNIIRQGLSLSFFVLGISLVFNKNFLIGIFVFFISFSFHRIGIVYIIAFLITFLFSFKKETKVIFLFLISIASVTSIPYEFVSSLGITYIDRVLSYIATESSFSFITKFSFYLFFFLIFDYLMIKESYSVKKINLLYFFLISLAILIFESEVSSVRFLLSLDFLFPILLLTKASIYNNKDYFFFSLFLIFLVFIISIYSETFRINFRF